MGGGVAMRAGRLLKERFFGPHMDSPPCLAKAMLGGIAVLAAQQSGAIESVAALSCIPKVFYHGQQDAVLPVAGAQLLHEAAAAPSRLKILENCAHDFYEKKDLMITELCAFVLEH